MTTTNMFLINGRTRKWVADANRKTQARLDAGEICAACGLTFGMIGRLGRVEKALNKPEFCKHCEKDLS